MIIFPAIDVKDGNCVRLRQGDYATAQKVAEDPLDTARDFARQGAQWIHMVDLDGAKDARPVNTQVFLSVAAQSGLKVELGGGIRSMKAIDDYLSGGVSRIILGSIALKNPALVKEAVAKYGTQIAVGIDARDGMVATEGWLDRSNVSYLDLAKTMEQAGVRCIIFTDISRDGMLSGPNLEQLAAINAAVSCDIIASGGIRNIDDIKTLASMGLYGAICGKSLYSGSLDLRDAITVAESSASALLDALTFQNGLIPAIIQQDDTGEVLMMAYMNRESLEKTLQTGTTWFYSRSRQKLWNKGESSGHFQQVVSVRTDCDKDTLLVRVRQQGPACHTGSHNCFYHVIEEEGK